MDGPLILYKAWLLSVVVIFFYRRFFETVGPRSEEFERFARSRPVLAAMRGDEAAVATATARLRERVAHKPKPVALLGGWPWPHYVLSLDARSESRIAVVALDRVALRRKRAPSVDILALLQEAARDLPVEVWVHALLRHRVRGPEPVGGYRLHGGLPGKPALQALAEAPAWIAVLGSRTETSSPRHLRAQLPGSISCSSSVNSAVP